MRPALRLATAALVAFLALPSSGCLSTDGGSAPFQGCLADADCSDLSDGCYLIDWDMGRGRMCTSACDVDAHCGPQGACFGLVGDPADQKVCYETCRSDYDCSAGFVCADAVREGAVVERICMPL